MTLEIKTQILKQDRSGRSVTVKDGTGFQILGRDTGYGTTTKPASSILAYHFVASKMFNSLSWKFTLDGSDDLLPTVQQFASGQSLELRTDMFSLQTDRGVREPCRIFQDGILNLDMYVEFEGMSGLVIEEGTNYITGGNFEDAWKSDAILVEGKIYQLDKSMDPNGYTVLYIVGSFEDDATSFSELYRGNTKGLLTAMSENLHDYACKRMKDNVESREWNNINVAFALRRAAVGLFTQEVPDYFTANDLIDSNFKLLAKFAI